MQSSHEKRRRQSIILRVYTYVPTAVTHNTYRRLEPVGKSVRENGKKKTNHNYRGKFPAAAPTLTVHADDCKSCTTLGNDVYIV